MALDLKCNAYNEYKLAYLGITKGVSLAQFAQHV